MVLPSFGLFGQAVSEEKNFFILTNQKKELPVAAMFQLFFSDWSIFLNLF
jgi:hypothetical protein